LCPGSGVKSNMDIDHMRVWASDYVD